MDKPNIWTEEDDKKLREFFESGVTTQIVADAVGRSRNAVIGRIYRLGLERDKPKPKLPLPPRLPRPPLPKPKKVSPQVQQERQTDSSLAIWNLTSTTCRWPLGAFGDSVTEFCGAKVANEGLPYCHYHSQLAYARSGN